MDEDQQQLLEAIARAVGVTPSVKAVTVRRLTVGGLYMAYRATRPRGRAWQMERNLLRPFVVAYWREFPGAVDWQAHRRARKRQKTRLGRPPCDLTLNLELAAVKRMLGKGSLSARPVRTRTRRESWFTAEQVDSLIDAARALRWRHQQRAFAGIASVMGDTGLRISEALSLRWDRITLRGVTSITGKGSKARVVALTPRTLTHLAAIDRHLTDPRVFLNHRRHTTYNPSTVRAWFRTAIEAAGLEGVKADGDLALVPHCLRHSFASIADERGAPASWIQQAMGHASSQTTSVYLHREEHDAAIRIAAIMSQRRPPKKISPSHEKIVVNLNRRGVTSFS